MFRQPAGVARERAEFARDHCCHLASAHTLGDEGRRSPRQPRPGGGQARHVDRQIERITEHRRLLRTQSQQIARGDDADDLTALVLCTEVPQLETAHAGEREIDKSSGRHGNQGLAGELPNRARERDGPLLGQSAQDIALGDNRSIIRAQLRA